METKIRKTLELIYSPDGINIILDVAQENTHTHTA